MAITRESMMAVLKRDFGIKTEEEFIEAYRKMKPLNISIFVTPIPNQNDKNTEEAI